MILTARDLAAEPKGKREPVEILLVVNILQTLHSGPGIEEDGISFCRYELEIWMC